MRAPPDLYGSQRRQRETFFAQAAKATIDVDY
jgi:hypothetical protein